MRIIQYYSIIQDVILANNLLINTVSQDIYGYIFYHLTKHFV